MLNIKKQQHKKSINCKLKNYAYSLVSINRRLSATNNLDCLKIFLNGLLAFAFSIKNTLKILIKPNL